MENEIKVFQIGDVEWWAGRSLQECIAASADEWGLSPEELGPDDSHELTDAEMKLLKFYPDLSEPERYPAMTFEERLQQIKNDPDTRFPVFFATTEI